MVIIVFYRSLALILVAEENTRIFKGDTAGIINLPEYPSSIDRAKITRSSERCAGWIM